MRVFPAILASLTLLALPSAPAVAQDVKAGRHIAEVYCARCHAIGRRGESAYPKATPFRAIYKKYPIENLEEAFGEGTTANHLGMPDFEFTPREVGDLLAYLKSFRARRGQ